MWLNETETERVLSAVLVHLQELEGKIDTLDTTIDGFLGELIDADDYEPKHRWEEPNAKASRQGIYAQDG